jgi:hypothetical protein
MLIINFKYMITTIKLQKAIKFAIKTHEVYQKQKRKGKDIAYITHPLAVALILSQARAKEEVVIAGILHDTIEDSIEKKRVSYEMIEDRFGKEVADLVLSVTEKNKDKSWDERKEEALEDIKSFSKDSLLLKSADVVANLSELVDDYAKDGEKVFERFNAPKEKSLLHHLRVIQAIISKWPENPLESDLGYLAYQLRMMDNFKFAENSQAKIFQYSNYNDEEILSCPLCQWQGKGKNASYNSDSHFCLEISCPVCDKILIVAEYAKISINN